MDRTRLATPIGGWAALMLVAAALACNAGAATSQPAAPAATTVPPTVQPASEEDKVDPNAAREAVKGVDSNKGSAQAGAPQAGASQATFIVRNDLSQPVCYVYISPTTADTWGSDWLGDTEIIDVSGQRTFNVDAGQWDVMAADCDNNELASAYGYAINGPTSWQPGQSTAISAPVAASSSGIALDLINDTDTTVCWVYLSPSTSDSWGGDWLGSSVIEPGQIFTFTLSAGTWDMTAEDCGSTTLDTQYGVVVGGPLTWTLSGSTSGGNAPLCGDGFCGDFENGGNCPQDCGSASEPLCGDGFCGDYENGGNCPADCYDVDFCGDGVCAAWEWNNVCVADCGYEGGLCGNGVCGDFENSGNCPADCGYAPGCGDGVCDMMESYDTCPIDCP